MEKISIYAVIFLLSWCSMSLVQAADMSEDCTREIIYY